MRVDLGQYPRREGRKTAKDNSWWWRRRARQLRRPHSCVANLFMPALRTFKDKTLLAVGGLSRFETHRVVTGGAEIQGRNLAFLRVEKQVGALDVGNACSKSSPFCFHCRMEGARFRIRGLAPAFAALSRPVQAVCDLRALMREHARPLAPMLQVSQPPTPAAGPLSVILKHYHDWLRPYVRYPTQGKLGHC